MALEVDAKDVNTPDKWVKRLGSGFDRESVKNPQTVWCWRSDVGGGDIFDRGTSTSRGSCEYKVGATIAGMGFDFGLDARQGSKTSFAEKSSTRRKATATFFLL